MDIVLPLISILLALVLIWWWPRIRVALRLTGRAPKIASDVALGLAQIALPPEWKQTDSLPSHGALQAVDRFRGRYLVVISEPLDDFDANVGLVEYTDRIMSARLLKQEVTNLVGPFERTVGPYQAMQAFRSARDRSRSVRSRRSGIPASSSRYDVH